MTYYRYEAKHPEITKGEWIGIFQVMNPDERRQWYCLTSPKWYDTHPNDKSKAWFTEHGYLKWKNKMAETIKNFHYGRKDGWEFKLIKAKNLANIVMKGKTQIIQSEEW